MKPFRMIGDFEMDLLYEESGVEARLTRRQQNGRSLTAREIFDMGFKSGWDASHEMRRLRAEDERKEDV